MISFKKFVFNSFAENTYLAWDNESKEAILIDPGCFDETEEAKLVKFISDNELKLKYLINTHCHIDHILGNNFAKEKYTPHFLAPEKDVFLLDLMFEESKKYGMPMKKSPHPDELLSVESVLTLGDAAVEVLFTPGHSPGEHSLYFEKEKKCVTGDVLFKEGIGRTDLWGGDYDQLIKSIEEKLFTLPDDVEIFPGHGESSSIGHEKKHNPFLT